MRKVENLTVLTTSQCTARCAHCCVSSGPERRDRLKVADIQRLIDETTAAGPMGVVVFAGGEPTLMGDSLLEAIAHAADRGMWTRVVTNASWAVNPAKARQKLIAMREAGLRELNISADDYHLPFIPFERVVTAFRASMGLGFHAVLIGNSYRPDALVTPEYINRQLGMNLPITFVEAFERAVSELVAAEDGTRYGIHNPPVQPLGRGRRELDHVFEMVALSELRGGCPFAVSHLTLSPKAHLVACCGIEAEHNAVLDFGDFRKVNVEDAITAAQRDPVLGGIMTVGPAALLQIAQHLDPSLDLPTTSTALCDACEVLTTNEKAVAVLRANPEAIAGAAVRSSIDFIMDGV